jgi:hypothetical protein
LNLFIAVVVNAMHETEPSPAELEEVKQEPAAVSAKPDRLLMRIRLCDVGALSSDASHNHAGAPLRPHRIPVLISWTETDASP